MFELIPNDLVEHDSYISIGPFGGNAGFIASREITASEALDASFTFDQFLSVGFALVITVTNE